MTGSVRYDLPANERLAEMALFHAVCAVDLRGLDPSMARSHAKDAARIANQIIAMGVAK